MPTIFIDGRELEVAEGRNVLQAALDHKLDLPYFCWHPAMGSVGACRLCAVKHYRDEHDEHGRIAMGCMTPATDGTRVAIDEPEAAQFRRSVIEWLMINHPHDCPVCDEGGECHLQDMTVMTGHAHRRYRGRKRTYRNQYLGPLIHHEMNRCIQCYRCVRFYDDHTGGHDLGAFASRDRVYFGRVEDGVLESPFAGNLVEVCPTGVFTDKTYRRHYTRKWDLQSAPSICGHCGLGCNTIVGARYGSVRRTTSRFNGEVNGYWLCDRGRFGYEHVNAGDRLVTPHAPRTGGVFEGDPEAVWQQAAGAVHAAATAGTLAAVGSPRASLESNFALRALAGADRFATGLADEERPIVTRFAALAGAGAIHVPSLQEVERCDVALVLATDLTHEAPLLDLALYRAHDGGGARVHLLGLRPGRVGEFSASFAADDPAAVAARAGEIATAIENDGDDPIADALLLAAHPLIVTGTQHRERAVLEAAVAIVAALHARGGSRPGLVLAAPEANTLGVELLAGGDGPGIDELIETIESGATSTLVVAENDLFERTADHARLSAALQELETLVVLDHMATATSALATHALPVATIAESTGTLVNGEGRMQRFYQVLRTSRRAAPSWSVAAELFAGPGSEPRWRHVDQVAEQIEADSPVFDGITKAAPPAGFRLEHQAVPRMGHRHSGRNATLARDALDDLAGVAPDDDTGGAELPVLRRSSADAETPLSFSMEGFSGPVPPELLARVWAPGWNSNEAINQFQIEVGGPLHGGDPGLRIFAANGAGPIPGEPAVAPARTVPEGVLVCAGAEIFASETTSRRAPALAELAPAAYVLLHPDRGERLGIGEGGQRVRLEGEELRAVFEAEIVFDDRLPEHVAVVPAGYPETRWWQRPRWMTLAAEGAAQ